MTCLHEAKPTRRNQVNQTVIHLQKNISWRKKEMFYRNKIHLNKTPSSPVHLPYKHIHCLFTDCFLFEQTEGWVENIFHCENPESCERGPDADAQD